MNKTLIVALASAMSITALAQVPAPENRTAKTIVIDSLAALPAQNPSDYRALMEALVQTKGEAVAILGSMCSSVNIPNVNYALAGMAEYVSQEGQEEARIIFAKALVQEISKTSEIEVKKFYLRLLAICAKDENTKAIGTLLADQALQETAASTLISINSDKADKVLAQNLELCSQELAAHIIGAAQIAGQEAKLQAWYAQGDADTKKTVLYALGQTGTKASLELLTKATQEAQYGFDNTGATDNLFLLLSRLAPQNKELVMQAAQDIFKASKAANQEQSMIAALELMWMTDAPATKALVLAAALDPNYIYRSGALNLIKKSQDESLFTALAQSIQSAQPDCQVTLINFLGDNHITLAADALEECLKSDKPAVVQAALLASARLQGDQDIIADICKAMRESENKDIIQSAQEALAYTKYDAEGAKVLRSELAKVAQEGSPFAQAKAIELLAARRASCQLPLVISKMSSDQDLVSKAAFAALPALVGAGNTQELLPLLIQAPAGQKPLVQDAICAALLDTEAAQRPEAIKKLISNAGPQKSQLYAALTRLGDKDTLQDIATSFATASPADQKLAIAAIDKWQGAPIFGILSDMVASCSDKNKEQLWSAYAKQIKSQKLNKENTRIFASNVLAQAPSNKQKADALALIANTGSYLGMMEAAPYMSDTDADVKEAACQAVMQIALSKKTYNGPQVVALLEECSKKLNNPDASYQQKSIAKHLAEINHKGGYVSLFNGKDLDGWKGLVANPIKRQAMSPEQLATAQAKADEQMHKSWSAKNGTLYFNGHGNNICTTKDYADFEMLVDWRLYKDGKEADAGIYLRGAPQVQMWDIRRTNVGAQVGSGGLYNNRKNPAAPSKVMDNELGEWNTFYIKMVGERVTVIMNGEKVVDNVILENFWKRDIPIFVKEQIELQAHGTEVEYKNIYIRELASKDTTAVLSEKEKKEGFKLLFNGNNTQGWQGNTKAYVAEDGCIVMYPKLGHGNLYTDKEYANFIMRFEFWMEPGTNNGLGIRTPMGVDAAYHGMELQILDNDAKIYEKLEKYQYHGSVYGVYAAKRGFLKPTGQWNVQEVIADGNHIKVILNGTVITDVDIAEVSHNNTKTLDGQKHPGLLNKKGYIGFLGHGSHVKFRNIRIKELP